MDGIPRICVTQSMFIISTNYECAEKINGTEDRLHYINDLTIRRWLINSLTCGKDYNWYFYSQWDDDIVSLDLGNNVLCYWG